MEQQLSDALIKKELMGTLGNNVTYDEIRQFMTTIPSPIIFSGTGELEITPELEAFFVRDEGIRSGEVTLRGTRLTPQEVIDIVDDGEREDYDYVSDEQIAACRQIVDEAPQWSTGPILDLDNCADVRFHVTRKEWSEVDYATFDDIDKENENDVNNKTTENV